MTMTETGVVPQFDLADRMRKAMRESKLSVEEAAVVLGLSRGTISRWINGQNVPSVASVQAIARLTGVDEAWLLGDVRPKGFEPPTFCSVVQMADREARCFYCGSDRHDTDDCPNAPAEWLARDLFGLAA